MKRFHGPLFVFSALLLVGCSGEPSGDDLRAAMEKGIESANAAVSKVSANPKMQSKLHSLKKIGCKADGDKAYICDVQVDVEAPFVGRTKQTAPMRVVKGPAGWTASQ